MAVYVAYLAPVLATGDPTFTGYVKLDDTATWMAMTDRVLAHGHNLAHLAPSTYEATLSAYLNGGEPVGALLPWGIGHRLAGQDLAWTFQPYLALLGSMLALSLWPLDRAARLLAAAARAGRVHRRAVGAALRLLALGRDQGDGRRGDPADRRRHRDPWSWSSGRASAA